MTHLRKIKKEKRKYMKLFEMFQTACIFDLILQLCFIFSGEASVNLTVPSAGNCEDETILTCDSNEGVENIGWIGLGRSLVINGIAVRPEDSIKYSQTVSGNSFSLIIHNTDIKDEGNYTCRVGFTQSEYKSLKVECKTENVNLSVTPARTVVITLDNIYPQPQIKLDILDLKTDTKTMVAGSFTKKCSSSNWLLDCEWKSINILLDGNYSYNATITTITTSSYHGHFRISSPNSITLNPSGNTYYIEENRMMRDVTCTADCAPGCQYLWRGRGDKNISEASVLALGVLDRTAGGEYTCTAWNWFGDVKLSIFVTVMYGPENLILIPQETSYSKTEGAVMENIQCSVTCSPNCSLDWFKGDTLVSSTGILTLRNVQRDDMGVYQCVATNDNILGKPSIQKSVQIDILYGPDTIILSSGTYIQLTEGKLAPNVTCSADCNPPCSFTWTNDSDSSSLTKGQFVESQGHILSFGFATHAIQGQYRCTVRNNATEKTIYTTLTVKVKPAIIPEKEAKVGTPVGAIAGGAVGAAVVVGLSVSAALVFFKRRKQNISKKNTEAQRKGADLIKSSQDTGKDVAYEGLSDRRDLDQPNVYDDLDEYVPVTRNIKEDEKTTQQGNPSPDDTKEIAYEGLTDRRVLDKKNVYDQLDVSVTDASAHYENTPKP